MRSHDRTVEQELARLAGRSHGVVTRGELLRAGITSDEIKGRLRRGALLREHPGVYRVGHRATSFRARYVAAVRACGDGSLLAGTAGAYLLALLAGRIPVPQVIVAGRRRVAGVRTVRTRRIDPRDAMVWDGIPVTTVARTIVDLAAVLDLDRLARVCHEAGVCHGTTPAQVEAVLARRPTSPEAGKLRRVLHGDVRVTLSALERRFLERVQDAGLPLPQTNRPAGGRRVDCRWPDHRLTVELDSYRFHHSRHAWEQGRRRDREAHARGDELRRYTWRDVFEQPAPMLAELGRLLPSAACHSRGRGGPPSDAVSARSGPGAPSVSPEGFRRPIK